jgi:hypothetical protein
MCNNQTTKINCSSCRVQGLCKGPTVKLPYPKCYLNIAALRIECQKLHPVLQTFLEYELFIKGYDV